MVTTSKRVVHTHINDRKGIVVVNMDEVHLLEKKTGRDKSGPPRFRERRGETAALATLSFLCRPVATQMNVRRRDFFFGNCRPPVRIAINRHSAPLLQQCAAAVYTPVIDRLFFLGFFSEGFTTCCTMSSMV